MSESESDFPDVIDAAVEEKLTHIPAKSIEVIWDDDKIEKVSFMLI